MQELYAVANELLGKPIKVTPTSKVVGDLALFLASGDIDIAALRTDPGSFDLPASVLGYLGGELGAPPAGFPEPFRTMAMAGRGDVVQHVPLNGEDDMALDGPRRRAVLSRLLFPGPWQEFEQTVEVFGDVSVIPTETFLYGLQPGRMVTVMLEPGVEVLVELQTVGEVSDEGMRTLHLRVNGQPRPVQTRDRSVAARRATARRADPTDPTHVGAVLPGVATPKVAVGDRVVTGQALALIEAMKMESTVSSPRDGTVTELLAQAGANVEVGDLLLVLT